MKKKHIKIINRTIQSIDWDKAGAMYKHTNWVWADDGTSPSAFELYNHARNLAERAIREKLSWLSTGGITIYWSKKHQFMQIFVGYSGDSA